MSIQFSFLGFYIWTNFLTLNRIFAFATGIQTAKSFYKFFNVAAYYKMRKKFSAHGPRKAHVIPPSGFLGLNLHIWFGMNYSFVFEVCTQDYWILCDLIKMQYPVISDWTKYFSVSYPRGGKLKIKGKHAF